MTGFQPDGYHTVTPRIITADVEGVVRFMKDVFGARGKVHAGRPAEIRIGDSLVIVSDGGGMRKAYRAFLYVYVKAVDKTYARAMAAGAVSVEAPVDMPYGDRRATFQDPQKNLWQVATRQK